MISEILVSNQREWNYMQDFCAARRQHEGRERSLFLCQDDLKMSWSMVLLNGWSPKETNHQLQYPRDNCWCYVLLRYLLGTRLLHNGQFDNVWYDGSFWSVLWVDLRAPLREPDSAQHRPPSQLPKGFRTQDRLWALDRSGQPHFL